MVFPKRSDRAAAEAAALRASAHPGVVELVGQDGDTLLLRLVPGRSVAELGPLPVDEVAGLAAAIATVLADLHDRGVVHGALDGTHVLVGDDGAPVLCSLGRDGRPEDDVAALGRLIADLAARAVEPGRRRHRARRGWRRPGLGPLLAPASPAALTALALAAADPDPARRPTAREFAAAVHQRVPTAALRPPPARALLPAPARPPAGRRRGGRGGRRRGGVGPGASGVSVAPAPDRDSLLAGVLGRRRRAETQGPTAPDTPAPGGDSLLADVLGRRRSRAGAEGPAAPAPDLNGDGATGRRPGERRTRVGLVAAALAVPAGLGLAMPALGGDGAERPRPASADPPPQPTTITTEGPRAHRVWPPPPLDLRDGVLTVDGARYALDEPGAVAVAGDWWCTGTPTVAVLRPSTGEVFAFAGWAEPGQDLVARPLGTVAGATGVRAGDADGDGCDDVTVDRHSGAPVPLTVPS